MTEPTVTEPTVTEPPRVGVDRTVLGAFLVASAVWLAGLAAAGWELLVLGVLAVVHLVPASLLLALRSLPTARGALASWGLCVALLAVAGATTGLLGALLGAVVATVFVGAWGMTGLFLLVVLGRVPLPTDR